MNILVDWDNYNAERVTASIASLFSDTLEAIPGKFLEGQRRLHFRFYGGWYEGDSLTRQAQQLASDLQAKAPYVAQKRLRDELRAKFTVSGEMAYGILALTGQPLPRTFRVRKVFAGIWAENPGPLACCNSSMSCQALATWQFVNNKRCKNPGCKATLGDVLRRGEQKLVDSMIGTDIVHLAVQGEGTIGLVSSDDDFWPPMLAAMARQTTILQLQPKGLRSTSSTYAATLARYHLSIPF